jgi:hypothetical protein
MITKMIPLLFSRRELLTNPRFDNGTTGWSFDRATSSVTNGVLKVTATAAYAATTQIIATVPGRTYRVRIDYEGCSAAKPVSAYAGVSAGSGGLGSVNMGQTRGTFGFSFTATTATTYIFMQDSNGNLAAGEFYQIDAISVR